MGAPKPGPSGGRIANSLVALSSAAVLTVYSAGYLRTRAAAQKLDAAERSRVVIPSLPTADAGPIAAPAPAQPTVAMPAPPAAKPRKTRAAPTPSAAPAPSPTSTENLTSAAPTSVATPTPVAAEPPAALTPAPRLQYKDGTYAGWGTSRHGDIEATVTIAGGKIVSAVISQCWTRYSCSWVTHLQGQVVDRQSPEVDYVSRATQSSNAFYYAVVQALSKAK